MWSTRRTRVRALQELALGLSTQGRFEEALAAAEECHALVAGRGPRGAVADCLHLRAFVLHDAGRQDESEASAREAIDVRRGQGGLDRDQTSRLSDSLELLANVLTKTRRLDEADAIGAEVVAMRETMPWPERARGLLNRSATLLESGREAEGLEVALDLVRGAFTRPGTSGISDPSFTQGLSNLGVLLRRNGRWSEALAVQDMAVRELRSLAEPGGTEARVDLARALANQALMHLECGRPDVAVAPGEEALAIREELAAASFDAFAPELAESLNNHAVLLHKLEHHADGEVAAGRCVEIRRTLHAAQPGAYERKLANALATHAEMLTRCDRADEAAVLGGEAVERLRDLEAAEPGQHTWWLASALDALAGARAASSHPGAAFATSQEAIARAREACVANRAGLGDMLAYILMASAERHAAQHRPAVSAWAEEAVQVLSLLAVEQPETHAVALARAEAVRAAIASGFPSA